MANVFKYNSTGFCNKVIKYSLNWAQIVSACVIKGTIMIFTLLKLIFFLEKHLVITLMRKTLTSFHHNCIHSHPSANAHVNSV